jgi:RNA polymerase sigma-70 factor (ECF subfamily)
VTAPNEPLPTDPLEVVPHLSSLNRYARVLTRDATAADDLVHDALLRAYERAGTFQAGRSLRAWLFSIVHNLFVSDQRREQAERRRDARFAEVRAQSEHGQDHTLLLRELALRFDALPEHQRSVVHLILVEGLSYQEAAAALDVPIGTIMSRLNRARAALRGSGPAVRAPLRVVGGQDDA